MLVSQFSPFGLQHGHTFTAFQISVERSCMSTGMSTGDPVNGTGQQPGHHFQASRRRDCAVRR